MKTLRRTDLRAAACALLSLWVTGAATAQTSTLPPPPEELRADWLTRHEVQTYADDEQSFLEADLRISTMRRQLRIEWTAALGDLRMATEVLRIPVSYHPTAIGKSLIDHRVFYVAGVGTHGPVLQRWSLGEPTLRASTSGGLTQIDLPAMSSPDDLSIDPTMKHISDLTVVKFPALGSDPEKDEVWVLRHEDRKVYAIADDENGTAHLQFGGLSFAGSRSLYYCVHETLGGVLTIRRRPFFVDPVRWSQHRAVNPNLDLELWLAEDPDRDGIFDPPIQVPYANLPSHPFLTGTIEDD